MRLVSGGRARGRALLLASTLLATATIAPAFAQSTGNLPPPTRYVLDANGVNLATGTQTMTTRDVTIGSGEASLSLDQARGLNGSGSRYEGYVYQSGTTFSATVFRGDGSRSYRFTQSGTTYASQTGEAATLTSSGTTYVLTLEDGSIYTFAETTRVTSDGAGSRYARLTRIQGSDGVQFDMAWSKVTYCPTNLDTCLVAQRTTKLRLQSVTSSYGYQLHYDYASDQTDTAEGTQDWDRLVSVVALNLAVDYCAPKAASCTLSRQWPGVSYSSATSGSVTTTNVSDALGRLTSYTNDLAAGGGFRVKRPSSGTDNVVVARDANNKVASVNVDGRSWGYAWALSGNLMTATITNPDNTQRVIVSDITVGMPVSVRDELNRTTAYAYDASGRLTRITAPEGNSVAYAYDARGNVTETRGVSKTPGTPADIVTVASYPASCANAKTCNQPDWTKDAKDNQTDYTYDANHGGVLTVTSPAPNANGVRPQARFGYSSLQAYYKDATGALVASGVPTWRLTSSSTCRTLASCAAGEDEVRTTIDYGPQSAGTPNNLLPISTTTGSGSQSLTATTTASYDAVGNQILVDGPLIATADTVRTIYDAARQPVGVIGPDPDAADPLPNRATRYSYNLDGQVTKAERGTTAGQSDAAWSGFSAAESVESAYDASGRRTTDTLKAGGTSYALTQYGYDAKGRLDCASVRMNSAVFGSLPDACGLSTQGTAGPDRITKTAYDAADEVTKTTSGLGTPAQADDARYTYRDNGKVETLIDANGNRTTYVYDGLDRLSQTRYPSTASPGTSSTTDYEGLSYDLNGNVTQRRLRDGQVIGYTYDALDRVTLKDVPTGAGENDVGFTYDNLGRILGLTGSTPTDLTYDSLGRTTSETTAGLTKSMEYDLGGRATRLTYPDGFFVGYDHLITGEVTEIRENSAKLHVGVLGTYVYDGLGHLTSLKRGNGVVTSYEFDPVSRLAKLTNNLGNPAANVTASFTYNPASQIASRTRDNDAYAWAGAYNTNRGYQVNGLNQYTTAGTASLAYDGRGNLTSSGSATYGYTSENRLVSAPATTLDYDLAGRLKQITGAATTRFDYLGLDLLTELDTNGGILRRYVHGPGTDDPLVWYEGSGTGDKRWPIPDERGSVVAVTGDSGQSIAINAYDEYGIPGTGNVGRFQYTGQTWLPELGLYYYKARMYSPTLGRFLQSDPIGYSGGTNLYGYAGGDPINAFDPLGLAIVVTAHMNRQNGGEIDSGGGGGGGGGAGGSSTNERGGGGDAIVVTGHREIGGGGGGGPGASGSSTNERGGTWNDGEFTPDIVVTAVSVGPMHQRYIQLTTLSYAHIFTQHAWFPFPNTSRFLPEFRDITSIYGLVGKTITGNTGVTQPNGNVRYEGRLPFAVGTDQLGLLTHYLTVIVRPTGPGTGDVITAYPGN